MSLSDQYPTAMTRDVYQEGGLTFLKRVLCTNLQTGEPVILKTGDVYASYAHSPEHTCFMDGVKVLQGDQSGEAYGIFDELARRYDVRVGITELRNEGKIQAPSTKDNEKKGLLGWGRFGL